MRFRNTLIATTIAATAFAGATLANDGHDKSGKAGASFDALDTNRDGRISRTEASVDAKIVFARADANGDGYLDTTEFSKARKMGDDPAPQSMPQPDEPVTPNTTEPVGPDSTTPPADTETPRQ
jgi:Ca2+-binding EF-hand superfamily protein